MTPTNEKRSNAAPRKPRRGGFDEHLLEMHDVVALAPAAHGKALSTVRRIGEVLEFVGAVVALLALLAVIGFFVASEDPSQMNASLPLCVFGGGGFMMVLGLQILGAARRRSLRYGVLTTSELAAAQLFGGRDRRRWRELDADVFKRSLLEAALDEGTVHELLPPELRAASEQAGGFYPFELSALVHRESTDFLFAAAQRDAVADGENLIIDGTLAWKDHAERLLDHLQQAGYTIHVVDVEAPQYVAAERIVRRWRDGLARALSDPADPLARLGGRWVPATAIDALFAEFREPDHLPLRGRSVTQVNALEVSQTHTAVGRFDLYRTEDAGRGADHVERRERRPRAASCS